MDFLMLIVGAGLMHLVDRYWLLKCKKDTC